MINCVALNANVSGEPARRVIGCKYWNEGITSNNRSFEDMVVTMNDERNQELYPTDKGQDKVDGADVSRSDALTALFWTNTMGWSGNFWDIADGRLPILKNVGGLQTTSIISITPDSDNNQVIVDLISPWQSDAVLIVASYSGGRILGISKKTIEQSGMIYASVNIENADTIKAFLWDDMTTMQPLCNANDD